MVKVVKNIDSTDIALMVSTSEETESWDRSRIVKSILEETSLSEGTAEKIAESVETEISETKLETITTHQIRELVNRELLKNGYTRAIDEYRNISIPIHDIKTLLFNANKENANQTHNPESINLSIAERIFKDTARYLVFDEEVYKAHEEGKIHIHDLGFITRPYCGGHSLEYIKRYGLDFPSITSVSKPAKHIDVLIGHMVKFASVLQSNYAGAVGWEAVNMFFAPFLINKTYEEIKQAAQMLIFEFNQLAGARGGQVVFTDFNLYYGIPKHFQDTPVIGPGGKYIEKDGKKLTYKDFENESNLFLKALFEVYNEGDASGKTFFFPKPLLHINEESIKSPGWEEFFELACKVAADKGITYFIFDRGSAVTVSQCCRLKLKLGEDDLKLTKTPEKMRFTALQNVTVNLPRIAMEVLDENGKWDKGLFAKKLDERIDLVAKAHIQKKTFFKKLLKSDSGLLAFFKIKHDGNEYINLSKLTYLCGILGLNETVELATGKQLHESKEAYELGYWMIGWMNLLCQKYSNLNNINLVLEESPAESSGYRLAKIDKSKYPELSKKVLKGNPLNSEFYYTNSIHLAYDAKVDYVTRVDKQAKFHPLITAGSIIHIWLGEQKPPAKSIEAFVMNTYKNTDAAQICFSPEFTVCDSCNKTVRGIKKKCKYCGSEEVYSVTRIVGYFSKIQNWNKGKLAELKDRVRGLEVKDNKNDRISI